MSPSLAAALPPGGRAAQGFPGPLPHAAGLLTPVPPAQGHLSWEGLKLPPAGQGLGDVDKPQGSGLTVLPALGPLLGRRGHSRRTQRPPVSQLHTPPHPPGLGRHRRTCNNEIIKHRK